MLCGTTETPESLAALQMRLERRFARSGMQEGVVTIPIIFLCVGTAAQVDDINLTDEQLQHNIDQLNQDFAALNDDYTSKCPTNMLGVRAGDIRIRFDLYDIKRSYQNIPGANPAAAWHSFDQNAYVPGNPGYTMTKTSLGGIDQIDPDHFCNVWLGRFSVSGDQTTDGARSGWAWYPGQGGAAATRGVVVQSQCVGSRDSLCPDSFLPQADWGDGRLLTHEVGHYLGLRHSWGTVDDDATTCARDDQCPDLPLAPNYILNTQGITPPNLYTRNCDAEPYNNHMNYGVGKYQSSFTPDQSDVMRAAFDYPSHKYVGTACIPIRDTETLDMRYNNTRPNRVYLGEQVIFGVDGSYLAFYPLESDASDEMGGANATVFGQFSAPSGYSLPCGAASSLVPSQVGRAVLGATQAVSYPSDCSLGVYWVNTGGGGIQLCWNATDGNFDAAPYAFAYNTEIVYGVRNFSATYTRPSALPVNAIEHLAFSISGTDILLFVNGNLVASHDLSGANVISPTLKPEVVATGSASPLYAFYAIGEPYSFSGFTPPCP